MVNYAQLRNLDTSKLTSAAEAAGGLSGTLSARGGEVATASQIPSGMWAGMDASAASVMMSPLSMPLYDVSDSANTSQGVITTLVTELEQAKTKLDDAHDVIAGTGITISADGTVTTPVVDDPAIAAENDRKAQQARTIIDEAVTAANQADDKASGALASAGEFLGKMLGPPQNSPLGPWGTASWGVSQGIGRFGNLASWMGTAHYGRFAPKGPNGQFISPRNMSAWQRALAGANGEFRATPYNSSTRAAWSTAGKWAGRAGGVLGVGTAAASQAAKDWNNPNMGTTEKVGRAAYSGAATGGGAWAGGVLGAKVGAGIGTLIAPGVGTVVGGAIGGVVGGIAGSQAGTWIANNTVDAVGNGVEWAGDKIGDGLDAAGDALDKITPW